MNALCRRYPVDLPQSGFLFAEIELFVPYLKEHATRHVPNDTISYRYAAEIALRQSHFGLFPTLAKAFKLLLTATPTVCKDERSSSKLKFVKSYLRNTMGNDRLDALMLLACEKNVADGIDLKSVAQLWSRLKQRRIRLITE